MYITFWNKANVLLALRVSESEASEVNMEYVITEA